MTPSFNSACKLRGYKRSVYLGGVRSPFIVRAPGSPMAGQRTNWLAYYPDLLVTMADLAGIQPSSLPKHDGVSFKQALYPGDQHKDSSSKNALRSGSPSGVSHVSEQLPVEAADRQIYWEFCHQGNDFGYGAGWAQSVFSANGMHGIRMNKNYTSPTPDSDVSWELYNTTADLGEETNLAGMSQYAPVLKSMGEFMDSQHEESSFWPSGRHCVDHCYSGSCPRPGSMSAAELSEASKVDLEYD